MRIAPLLIFRSFICYCVSSGGSFHVFVVIICLFSLFSSVTAIPSREEKKGNGCARGWCVRRVSLLQDRLPVKFQDVKFKDPKFKHEIFNEAFILFHNLILLLNCLLFAKN